MIGTASRTALGALAALALSIPGAVAQDAVRLAAQNAEYEAVRAKDVIALQPFRSSASAVDAATGRHVTLVSLNPATDAWFLLQLRATGDGAPESFHIENPDPARQDLVLRQGPTPRWWSPRPRAAPIAPPGPRAKPS